MTKLSKAQRHVVEKLQNKSMLIGVHQTWQDENVFFRNPDDTYERSNLKVIRTMVSKGLLTEQQTSHFLIKQYDIDVKGLEKVSQ